MVSDNRKNANRKARGATVRTSTTGDGTERVTVSLHGADMERINALEDYLTNLGRRERNRSLLVKVALRGVDFTPELVEHLDAAKAGDGRRDRPRKEPVAKSRSSRVETAQSDGSRGAERVTLSLHEFDRARIDAIQAYLRKLGHREHNRSLLVKVALRGVALTPKVVEHLEAAHADDGRRKRG